MSRPRPKPRALNTRSVAGRRFHRGRNDFLFLVLSEQSGPRYSKARLSVHLFFAQKIEYLTCVVFNIKQITSPKKADPFRTETHNA